MTTIQKILAAAAVYGAYYLLFIKDKPIVEQTQVPGNLTNDDMAYSSNTQQDTIQPIQKNNDNARVVSVGVFPVMYEKPKAELGKIKYC
jgi:hypothetical protein